MRWPPPAKANQNGLPVLKVQICLWAIRPEEIQNAFGSNSKPSQNKFGGKT